MRFVYEKEEVPIRNISELSGLSTIDIITLGKVTKNMESVKIGGFDYKVLHNMQPKKKVRKPANRLPLPTKAAEFTNVVKQEGFNDGKRRRYYIDGVNVSYKAFAKRVGISESSLYRRLDNITSATINGVKCTIKAVDSISHVIKDLVIKPSFQRCLHKSYKVDGVPMERKEVEKHINIIPSSLRRFTSNAESVNIDGYQIEIIRTRVQGNPNLYILQKDGIKEEPMTKEQAAEKTGLNKDSIVRLARTGNYSSKGWRVFLCE